MKTSNTALLISLQSLLAAGQVINAGIGVISHNEVMTLIVGGIVAGLSVAVQHIGNQTQPTPKQ